MALENSERRERSPEERERVLTWGWQSRYHRVHVQFSLKLGANTNFDLVLLWK